MDSSASANGTTAIHTSHRHEWQPPRVPPQRPQAVDSLMSSPVLTVEPSETLWDAWQLLFVSGLRHIVVIDQDSCRGVLTDRQVLSSMPLDKEHLRLHSVGDALQSGRSLMASPGASIEEVARLMYEAQSDSVAIVDENGHVLGIVTSDDIVRWVASK